MKIEVKAGGKTMYLDSVPREILVDGKTWTPPDSVGHTCGSCRNWRRRKAFENLGTCRLVQTDRDRNYKCGDWVAKTLEKR